jgi:hypothetical protein
MLYDQRSLALGAVFDCVRRELLLSHRWRRLVIEIHREAGAGHHLAERFEIYFLRTAPLTYEHARCAKKIRKFWTSQHSALLANAPLPVYTASAWKRS